MYNVDSNNVKSIFSINRASAFQVFYSLVPHHLAERCLLFCSWFVYFVLGSYIALSTSIIGTKLIWKGQANIPVQTFLCGIHLFLIFSVAMYLFLRLKSERDIGA